MPVKPNSWSASPRGVGLLVALFVALALVLVVVLTRGLAEDPSVRPAPAAGETSAGSPTDLPAATGSPDSKPSSGPTEVPEPGSLEPVKVEEVVVAAPVGLDETADFGTGLTLRVDAISAVDGVGRGPGQVSGPALQLVMEARNASERPVSLEGMVVDLTYGTDDTPAMPLREPGAKPFEGDLPAKGAAHAVYIFAVPEKARGHVTLNASYTGSAPTLVFEGAASPAAR